MSEEIRFVTPLQAAAASDQKLRQRQDLRPEAASTARSQSRPETARTAGYWLIPETAAMARSSYEL